MADYYIDDNETIYASDVDYTSTNTGLSDYVTLGLSDLTELPGQSTWFINKIHFQYRGFVQTPNSEGYGHVLAGVVRRDITAATAYDNYSDFQDVKGFPLKGTKKYFWYVMDPANFGSVISVSSTWTPRKALLLNREQDIIFTVKNTLGSSLQGILSIIVQAKRGD